MLEYITWNVSRQIIKIGSFEIRWYGLLFGLGFVFAYLVLQRIFKKEEIKPELLDKLTLYIAVATVVGARLGHVLFYEPAYYFSHPVEILKVWEGGLASHGAAIAIILAAMLFARVYKLNVWWLFDRISIIIPLVAAFVRTGNLVNSEIFGKPTNVPWAFIFVRADSIPRHPTQIYEAGSYILLFLVLLAVYYKKGRKLNNGFIAGLMLSSLFTMRFIIEFFKDVQVNFEHALPIDMGQIMSIPLVLTGIAFMLFSFRKKEFLS